MVEARSPTRNGPYAQEAKAIARLAQRGWVSLNQFAALVGISYPTALKLAFPERYGRDGPPGVKVVPTGGINRVYHDEIRRFLTEGNRGGLGEESPRPSPHPEYQQDLWEALGNHGGEQESD